MSIVLLVHENIIVVYTMLKCGYKLAISPIYSYVYMRIYNSENNRYKLFTSLNDRNVLFHVPSMKFLDLFTGPDGYVRKFTAIAVKQS